MREFLQALGVIPKEPPTAAEARAIEARQRLVNARLRALEAEVDVIRQQHGDTASG